MPTPAGNASVSLRAQCSMPVAFHDNVNRGDIFIIVRGTKRIQAKKKYGGYLPGTDAMDETYRYRFFFHKYEFIQY
jgi:hypothetical protein